MTAPIVEEAESPARRAICTENCGVTGFERDSKGDAARGYGKRRADSRRNGSCLPSALNHDVHLAKAAGLEIGVLGGIRVDERMRTKTARRFSPSATRSKVTDFVTGRPTLVPLAGPANRQGRLAADAICGRPTRYRGTQGTSICQIFEGVIALTGASEKLLTQLGETDFEKIYLYPNSHAGPLSGRQIHRGRKSSFASPTVVCSACRCLARTAFPRGSTPSPWRSRWA